MRRSKVRGMALSAWAAGAMALLSGCGLTDQGDNVVNGKQLFVARCGSCHILERAGTRGVTGPSLDAAFERARQDGFGQTTFKGIVHRQIQQPARSPQVDPATGKILPLMPANLVGGEDAEDGADRLVGIGILASLPAIASGLSEWADTIGPDRRTGLVHAWANSAALTLYGASFLAHKSGRRGLGVTLGLLGGGAMGVGGWIGGHLSYGHGVGVDATTFEYPPTEWTAVLAESDLAKGEPRHVDFGGVAALVTKIDGRIAAISNSCMHRGGQLDGGSVEDGCVECPIHQSIFSLEDGSVVRGPATAPQPTYDVRVRDGQVELRGS